MKPFYTVLSYLLIFLCAACEPATPANTLTMGTSSDYPPFEFQDNGKTIGFDIDIAQELTKELEKKLVIKGIDFGGLIPALNAGKIDFIISAMGKSAEREKFVDFSDPYYEGKAALLTNLDSNITNFESMKGKTFAVQLGNVWEPLIKEKSKQFDFKIFLSTLTPPMIEELKLHRVDAVLLEEHQATTFVKQYPKLTMHILDQESSPYVIVFKKDSPLTSEFNKVIATLKDNGTLDKISAQWFK